MYYDILKASKVKAEVFPDYWTLLWGRKLSASMIKTITGVLPLTFTAKGGTAVDWVIYGNNNQQGVGERTKNLFDCRKSNNGYTDITVAGVRFLYGNQSITLSQTANGRYPQQQIRGENGILTLVKNTQYYGILYIDNAPENANIYMLLQASTDGSSYTTIATIGSAGVTFTPNDDYIIYRWLFVAEGEGFTYNNTVVKFAIVEGNTAPQTYIPHGYQIPISVQGKNLFDISTMIDPDSAGKYLKNDGTAGNEAGFVYTTYIPIAAQRVRLDNVTGGAASICCYDANKNFIRGQMYYQQNVILLSTSDAAFVRFSLKPVMESNAALFGLNDYTFYIGDSPLTEGETVSKSSTGVDIELFEGENTISTTLYNKPEMEIRYK